jgi:CubicO group peptidase (beta-lactamase class C family)
MAIRDRTLAAPLTILARQRRSGFLTGIRARRASRVVLIALAVLCIANTSCTRSNVAHGSGVLPAFRPSSAAGPLLTRPVARPGPITSYLDGLASSGQFSGTVLVARSGRVLLDAGYGLADRATSTPNGPATIFQIGSVTKQFTAMAIAILARQGKVRLEGRACGYLPGCPSSWRSITIAELLTHTSGIANWSTWNLTGPLPGEATDPIAAIVTYAESQSLAFPPGTQAAYSNPGYVVLGEIIEHISGMTYAAFLDRNIFSPLRMTHTGVYHGQATGRLYALGYLADDSVAPTYLTADSSSAGAIYSTAGDLYRWDQALITGTPRLVAPPLLHQILTVHAPCPYQSCPLPADRGYGYGWFVGGTGRAKLLNHSGSVLGFWAYNGFYPARDVIVVILGNLDTIAINPISAQLNQLASGG